MPSNRSLVLANAVPSGWPEAGKDLIISSTDFDVSQPPPPGGLTLRICYLSLDPFQRGRMRPASMQLYAAAYTPGEPLWNRGIAQVLSSDNAGLGRGDVVVVEKCAFSEYTTLSKEELEANGGRAVSKLANPYGLDPAVFLGALGMPGLTAYSSLYEIGKPKAGETIFVSSAAGAVGMLVGQLAKREGLRVIGSVGDEEKKKFVVEELGFDGCFNYKTEDVKEALGRLALEGLDVYYDNVGGEQLEAAIGAMKSFGRIVCCGMISQYNLPPAQAYPIRNLAQVVGKRLSMRGFVVFDPDFGPKYHGEHQENVAKWISDGILRVKSSVTEGMERGVEGLLGMFRGENFGKAVLKVGELDG